MRSCALALKRCARTVRALVNSPSPSTFTPSASFLMMPCLSRISGVTMVPASKASSLPTLTSANSFLKRALVKPRFGTRRWSGIWPPSNPSLWLKPLRLFWPFSPRPDVLPRPLPGPRPTRLRSRPAPLPLAGFRLFRLTGVPPSVDDGYEVRDLLHHPAHGGGVDALHHLVQAAQAQASHRLALLFGAADDAADHLDLDGARRRGALASGPGHGLCPGRRFSRRRRRYRPAFVHAAGGALPLVGARDLGHGLAAEPGHALRLLQAHQRVHGG